ncbi:MAG: peptide MFS transporter [Pyrinomonadaceae bacterium]
MDNTLNADDFRDSVNDKGGLGGQPRGLTTLFFTEMWERFSFYGMKAILFLYMTAKIQEGGLGFTEKDAGPIFGLYASSVYFLPLIGGWLADRYIGAKRATVIGGFIIMLGHFALAVPTLTFFYLGLILVSVGTGFLKSNISAMVGDLYDKDDPRRDGGFSIFYMGINIGATIAPPICGYLAQSESFAGILTRNGIDPRSGWHFGFAAAGVGMGLGLVQYYFGRNRLKNVGLPPAERRNINNGVTASESLSTAYVVQLAIIILLAIGIIGGYAALNNWGDAITLVLMPTVLVAGLAAVVMTGMQNKLSVDDWKRIGVIFILFVFSTLFWMGFEQASTVLNAFADKLTDTSIGGWSFPASYLQSVNPGFLIIFAPVFAWIWTTLGKRQPSDPIKFSIGLIFGGLGFVVVAFASSLLGSNPDGSIQTRVTFWWLILVYFCFTVGELCLSPVGLSSMTKLAPAKMVSLMLGVWFLSISMGNYIAGQIAGTFVENSAVLVSIFSKVAMIMIGGGVVLALISPFVNKLASRPMKIVPTKPVDGEL